MCVCVCMYELKYTSSSLLHLLTSPHLSSLPPSLPPISLLSHFSSQVNLQLLAVTPAILSIFLVQGLSRTLVTVVKNSSRGRFVESTGILTPTVTVTSCLFVETCFLFLFLFLFISIPTLLSHVLLPFYLSL